MTLRSFSSFFAVATGIACFALCVCFFSCSQISATQQQVIGGTGPVVLDIGHFIGSEGAATPSAINGKRISECPFWYQYSYYVKKVVESAGYPCIVTNRGNAPKSAPLTTYASRAGVVQLNHPDRGCPAERYPSKYHPDRVGSGVISADYAISKKAACVVFLHHNSISSSWTSGSSMSLVIYNRYNGKNLASCLARRMDKDILNVAMPNGGRGCVIQPRYVDADRSASWMNACDDSGIPAAVIEVAYLNNRDHATFLVDDANARRYAEAVGRGIVDFMRAHGNDPRHYRTDGNKADEGSFGYAAESRRLNVPGAKHLVH